MRRSIVLALSVLSILAALSIPALAAKAELRPSRPPAASGEAESARSNAEFDDVLKVDGGPAGMPPRIYNRVITLLDDEVLLSTAAEDAVWESRPFDTSQFNKIGLRVATESERGVVICSVGWRYTRYEEFLGAYPIVALTRPVPVIDDPGRRPDGIPDLYLPRPYYVPYPQVSDFAEVRGLQAMVRCTLNHSWADYGRLLIGDDPSLIDDRPEPVDLTASLSDVKVLLRRD